MSLKKIAELAGTSVATVSRVLNNPSHHCHDKNLEEKIWQIATKLHYTPNCYAQNLRKGTSEAKTPYTVDIYLTRFDSMEEDPFFMELFQCIKKELLENGCVLGEFLYGADIMALGQEPEPFVHVPFKSASNIQKDQKKNPLSLISQKKNTGLIILGKCSASFIPILKKRYHCIAGIDRNPTDYEYDEVICNGATAAEKAMEYLLSLGHRKIAYIGDCTYESRYIGYYRTLLEHNIPLKHSNVYPTNQTTEAGFSTTKTILQNPDRPTAIFCANDSTALGVIKALHSNKKGDYNPSVISIDNIKESENTNPMLTTIHIPKQEMGHLALSLLLDRKNGKHRENIRIELPCRLMERESCYLCR